MLHQQSELSQLLMLSNAELQRTDVALLNLLAARGLPGAERLDIERCLRTLDSWAEAVRRYVTDSYHEFRRNTSSYFHHEGFFLFLSMVTLLKHPRGMAARYQPTAIDSSDFSDSRDDFLHGVLTRKLGTCASLPVIFVAIGRRLGWPMHLAVAKRHVLCQWVHDGSRRNLEGSCPGGGDTYPDEHYYRWPAPLTRDELASGRYLRPLNAAESLALFLETRGHCLVDNGRFDEAHEAYAAAYRLAPNWSQYDGHLSSLKVHEALWQRGSRGGAVTQA